MIRALIFIFVCVWSARAQVTYTPPTDADLLQATNNARSSLSVAMTPTTGVILLPPADLAKFADYSRITIGNEIISTCGKTSTSLIVCSNGRGAEGTVAEVHGKGSVVEARVTAGYHAAVTAAIKQMAAALGVNLLNVPAAVFEGTIPAGDCIQMGSNGRAVGTGKPCGTGSGSMTWGQLLQSGMTWGQIAGN